MKFYKIGRNWVDLDHVLSVSEPRPEISCGHCLVFEITLMFLNAPIIVRIETDYQRPEELAGDYTDDEKSFYGLDRDSWGRRMTEQRKQRERDAYHAAYLRVKWTKYNDFLKQLNIEQEKE